MDRAMKGRGVQTTTARQRQQARDEASLSGHVKVLDHAKRQRRIEEVNANRGPNAALDALARAFDTRQRLALVRRPATGDQLALVNRHFEEIIAAQHPKTGEVIVKGKRFIPLTDVMHRAGQLNEDLWNAADRYRQLFLQYLGPSRGVSGYGDYIQAAPPSDRCGVTDRQMTAGDDLKRATVAAFAVRRQDGIWVVDAGLMHTIIPAMIDGSTEVSQTWIGRERTNYKGAMQLSAAGATSLREVLHRLALHFGFRRR